MLDMVPGTGDTAASEAGILAALMMSYFYRRD